MNNDELEYDYFEDMPSPATMEKKKRKRRRIIIRVVSWALVIILAVVIIGAGVAIYMTGRGGKTLQEKTADSAPVLDNQYVKTEEVKQMEETVEWQSDWVMHNDIIYDYNENIMAFLLLGIDKKGELVATDKLADGGQSDAMFLAVVNPDKKKIDLIGINRDTMVDVHCYGYELNGEIPIVEAQITTQYGFGNGRETSAEYAVQAVSDLFYSLPINGYVAIGYDAIPALNDLIGGVDLECITDLTYRDPGWGIGAQLHLEGEDALRYVRLRDVHVFESARGRLDRQKQYINAFIQKAVSVVKEDVTIVATMYEEAMKYMCTDISIDQMLYLAKELSGYEFGGIYSMEGETVLEDFEQFYPDYDQLKELILQLFYEPVELD